ncbi:hypothetical protein D3C81_1174780 [compost metagenome]
MPNERQKRFTVGSLTADAWASAAMLKRVACCGFCSITSATLRSALFSSSRRDCNCSSRFFIRAPKHSIGLANGFGQRRYPNFRTAGDQLRSVLRKNMLFYYYIFVLIALLMA